MKNRRIIFLAACMCSVVFLSGCSTDSLMDKMMGTETTVSSSASVDISKEDSDAVHVDANLEKPVFFGKSGGEPADSRWKYIWKADL